MTAAYDTTEGDKQRARELLIHHVRKFIPDPVTCFLMPGVTAHDAMLVKKEFANCRIMYGKQPDHDGHNKKGWRIYNDSWGCVAGLHGTFVAVQPK